MSSRFGDCIPGYTQKSRYRSSFESHYQKIPKIKDVNGGGQGQGKIIFQCSKVLVFEVIVNTLFAGIFFQNCLLLPVHLCDGTSRRSLFRFLVLSRLDKPRKAQ